MWVKWGPESNHEDVADKAQLTPEEKELADKLVQEKADTLEDDCNKCKAAAHEAEALDQEAIDTIIDGADEDAVQALAEFWWVDLDSAKEPTNDGNDKDSGRTSTWTSVGWDSDRWTSDSGRM